MTGTEQQITLSHKPKSNGLFERQNRFFEDLPMNILTHEHTNLICTPLTKRTMMSLSMKKRLMLLSCPLKEKPLVLNKECFETTIEVIMVNAMKSFKN